MTDIAHVIQLAVAPVFLLAGISGFINAFASRLGRIFDRSRLLEEESDTAGPARRAVLEAELRILSRRARLAYFGIALATLSALLVCLLITIAFAGYFVGFESRALIGALFIAAMVSLIGGLCSFLREVFYAVRSLSIGAPKPDSGPP